MKSKNLLDSEGFGIVKFLTISCLCFNLLIFTFIFIPYYVSGMPDECFSTLSTETVDN